jgi:uncharacterized protein
MSKAILHVYVKPNAKQSKIVGKDDRGLIIALKAKPQDGAANEELIRYLAEICGTPKSKIILLRGATARIKQIELPNQQILQTLLDSVNINKNG